MSHPFSSIMAGSLVCNLIGFYGHPEVVKREESWRLLELISSEVHLPWFCYGALMRYYHPLKKEDEGIDLTMKWLPFRHA